MALIGKARRALMVGLLVVGGGWVAVAQDVLVYRPLDNSDVVSQRPDIVFELEVTAFSTIRSVTVNGAAQAITPDTFATVSLPTRLKPGVNTFEVVVRTESGEVHRTFEIELVVPGEEVSEKKKQARSD